MEEVLLQQTPQVARQRPSVSNDAPGAVDGDLEVIVASSEAFAVRARGQPEERPHHLLGRLLERRADLARLCIFHLIGPVRLGRDSRGPRSMCWMGAHTGPAACRGTLGLCVYLASSQSSCSTGSQFVADGGMIADL